MNRRAFTLIELLVVIAVIGLLSSIAVVSLGGAREKARVASGKQFATTVDRAVGDQTVGYWNFDECSGTTANDSSGNNNGTFVGSPTWSTNTPSGSGCSLNFTAAANYINIPDSSSLDLSNNFTISFWVYQNNVNTSIFMLKGSDSLGGLAPAYGFGGNGFMLATYNVSLDPYAPRRGSDTGVWHQFVGTVNGSNVRSFYLDGHFAGTATGAGTSWNNSIDLLIGGNTLYSANALLDEIHVYSGALTAMQVHKLYAEESDENKIALETINKSSLTSRISH